MKLTIIIVSYNVKHYLVQCLDSVQRAIKDIDAEVCVVDNHSKDGTVSFLKSHFQWVKLIVSARNNGFSKGNNIAIRQSKSQYVLLLNPDTIIGEDVLRLCLEFMDAHEDAGSLGVNMLDTNGMNAPESRRGTPYPLTAFYKMSGLCARWPKNKIFGRYYMGWLPWDKPSEIDIVSGAFMMISRSALNKAGLLDEDYFMYGEDIDLSYRIKKAGFKNWFLPVQILHYKGESTKKTSFRHVHVFYKAMLIFIRKHYRHLSAWLSVPVKAAIYMKATAALISITAQTARQSIGFSAPRKASNERYIFIGRASSIEKCRALSERNGLNATFHMADETEESDGHLSLTELKEVKTPTIVVYDTSAYAYKTILRNFSNSPCPYIYIGTYNPTNDIIITANNIFV